MPVAEGLEGETMGLARRESLDNFLVRHSFQMVTFVVYCSSHRYILDNELDVPTFDFNFCSGKALEREELDPARRESLDNIFGL